MSAIQTAKRQALLAVFITGLVFFSLFFTIVAIPWHSTHYEFEMDSKTVMEGTVTVDPSYVVTVINGSSLTPAVFINGKEYDENASEEEEISYEKCEDVMADNRTDIYKNTKYMVAASFGMSIVGFIFIALVDKQTVKKNVGALVVAVVAILILSTVIYFPHMNATQDAEEDPDSSYSDSMKTFFYNSSSETSEEFGFEVKSTTSNMVGLGWILMLTSGLLMIGAASSTAQYFVLMGQQNLSKKKGKEKGSLYANIGNIKPENLDREISKAALPGDEDEEKKSMDIPLGGNLGMGMGPAMPGTAPMPPGPGNMGYPPQQMGQSYQTTPHGQPFHGSPGHVPGQMQQNQGGPGMPGQQPQLPFQQGGSPAQGGYPPQVNRPQGGYSPQANHPQYPPQNQQNQPTSTYDGNPPQHLGQQPNYLGQQPPYAQNHGNHNPQVPSGQFDGQQHPHQTRPAQPPQ